MVHTCSYTFTKREGISKNEFRIQVSIGAGLVRVMHGVLRGVDAQSNHRSVERVQSLAWRNLFCEHYPDPRLFVSKYKSIYR